MFYLKQYNNTLLKFDIVTDNLDGQKILSLTTADGFDETVDIGHCFFLYFFVQGLDSVHCFFQ